MTCFSLFFVLDPVRWALSMAGRFSPNLFFNKPSMMSLQLSPCAFRIPKILVLKPHVYLCKSRTWDCKVFTRAARRSVSLFWAVKLRSISPTPDSHEFIRYDWKSKVLITSLISLEFRSTSVLILSIWFQELFDWPIPGPIFNHAFERLFILNESLVHEGLKVFIAFVVVTRCCLRRAALRCAEYCSRVMHLAASS